jgi:hypothetical protein
MYMFEWGAWDSFSNPDKTDWKHYSAKDIRDEFDAQDEARAKMFAARRHTARFHGPTYACNDTYLEVRCGMMENRRGLMTLALLMWWGFAITFLCTSVYCYNDGVSENWEIQPFWTVAGVIFTATVGLGSFYIYFRYLFKYSRWELFTTRHLLARFNRVTRQVYLHRPRDCGGIVVMPWDEVIAEINPGLPLGMKWNLQEEKYGPYGFPPVLICVGRLMGVDEQANEWEFFRRYMNEGGLQAVEKPEIYTHWPTPIQAFESQIWGLGMRDFIRERRWFPLVMEILLSPGSVPIKLGHWVSLLLCIRPRWPKIIEEAGQPGKPVPEISKIDDYPPEIAAKLKENAFYWKPSLATDEKEAEGLIPK